MDQFPCFGFPFSFCSVEELLQFQIEQLEKPAFSTVVFVTADQEKTLVSLDKEIKTNPGYKWFPGDRATNLFFRKKRRLDMPEMDYVAYYNGMFADAVEKERNVCILTETKEELDHVTDQVRKVYPYLAIDGVTLEGSISSDAIVNEINGYAPDILILHVRTGEVVRFLEYDRSRTNATVCVCIGRAAMEEFFGKRRFWATHRRARRLERAYRQYEGE